MVRGVTRSKGCITCRHRKVKCDEAKPGCNRCRRALLVCEGYLQNNSTLRFVIARESARSPRTGGEENSRLVHAQRKPHLTRTLQSRRQSPLRSTVPATLDLIGFRENIWVSYLTTYLFPGSAYMDGDTNKQSWVLHAIDLDRTPATHLATCGLAAAFFTRKHGVAESQVKSSSAYYGKALIQLSTNLQDPLLWESSTNVATSFLLAIYEIVSFRDGHGWIQHAGGVGKLIEMRGPKCHIEEPARSYYKMCRFLIISRALTVRQRTFLEREEWQAISKIVTDRFDRVTFDLLNIIARIPGLLQDSDLAQCSQTSLESLSVRMISTIRELFVWRWRWERTHPHLAYEVQVDPSSSMTVDEQRRPLFRTILHYRHFYHGREPILYDTALLLLLELCESWSILDAIPRAIADLDPRQVSPQTNPLLLPREALCKREVCNEVFRSIEFFLQEGTQMSGALQLLLPLRIIVGHVKNVDKEIMRWLGRVMTKMAEDHGFEFSLRLRDSTRLIDDKV